MTVAGFASTTGVVKISFVDGAPLRFLACSVGTPVAEAILCVTASLSADRRDAYRGTVRIGCGGRGDFEMARWGRGGRGIKGAALGFFGVCWQRRIGAQALASKNSLGEIRIWGKPSRVTSGA
jgi:hypothetical protein